MIGIAKLPNSLVYFLILSAQIFPTKSAVCFEKKPSMVAVSCTTGDTISLFYELPENKDDRKNLLDSIDVKVFVLQIDFSYYRPSDINLYLNFHEKTEKSDIAELQNKIWTNDKLLFAERKFYITTDSLALKFRWYYSETLCTHYTPLFIKNLSELSKLSWINSELFENKSDSNYFVLLSERNARAFSDVRDSLKTHIGDELKQVLIIDHDAFIFNSPNFLADNFVERHINFSTGEINNVLKYGDQHPYVMCQSNNKLPFENEQTEIPHYNGDYNVLLNHQYNGEKSQYLELQDTKKFTIPKMSVGILPIVFGDKNINDKFQSHQETIDRILVRKLAEVPDVHIVAYADFVDSESIASINFASLKRNKDDTIKLGRKSLLEQEYGQIEIALQNVIYEYKLSHVILVILSSTTEKSRKKSTESVRISLLGYSLKNPVLNFLYDEDYTSEEEAINSKDCLRILTMLNSNLTLDLLWDFFWK